MDDIKEDFPQSDYYEVIETPGNASKENKNGVTFRGSDDEYFKAQSFLIEMTKKKGDRFQINGVEMYVADNPKNKPITIGIKLKNGISGKANLKIYTKNRRGSATILVTKVRGGSTEDVKNLAFRIVRYILDNVISGQISLMNIPGVPKKTSRVFQLFFKNAPSRKGNIGLGSNRFLNED